MWAIRSPAMTSQPDAPRKTRVALVFGGRSSEHAVSCSTAAGVMRAIDRDAYEVIPIGIARLITRRLGASIVVHVMNNFLPGLTLLLVSVGVI